MSETTTHSTPKKRKIWPWVTIVLLMLTLGGLRWALQSDVVLNVLREQAERIGSEQLNGTLSIESLRGDLLGELTVTGLLIQDDIGETVLEADTLYARYRIWSLVRGPFVVNEISVNGPRVYASQPAENQWNILNLLPESSDTTQAGEVFPVDIQTIRVTNGFISVYSPYLLPDNEISVDSLHVNAAFSIEKDGFKANLSALDLRLTEGRLPKPLAIHLVATADENRFNLSQLTVATGRSLLDATAHYAEDGEDLRLDAGLRPLSWRDVLAYTEEPFFVEDLTLGLEVRGGLSDLQIGVEVDAAGIQGLKLATRLSLADTLVVRRLELTSGALDVARVTGNAALPQFSSLQFLLEGDVRPDYLEASVFDGSFALGGIRMAPYSLDRVEGRFALDEGAVEADLVALLGDERIGLKGEAGGVFQAMPTWTLSAESSLLDVGMWAANPDLNIFAQVNLEASGTGLEPGPEEDFSPWNINATITEMLVNQQRVESVGMQAEITASEARLYTLSRLVNSEIHFNAALEHWQEPEKIAYSFYLETTRFDLREIVGFEDFPTAINLIALGKGTGFEPETMVVESSLEIDDSVVNGADIERFQANLNLQEGLLILDNTFLKSTFATGELDIRQRINDAYSTENRVDFNLEIGQLNPLAPLAGLSFLDASGQIQGVLSTGRNGIPNIETTLQLRDVTVNDVFVRRVEGRANVRLSEEIDYELDLRFSDATSGEFRLENVQLATRGKLIEDLVRGSYRITINFTDDTRFETQAGYTVHTNTDSLSVILETDVFELRDASYRYYLSRSFSVFYQNELVRMEPLVLVGEEGVELTVEFEQYLSDAFRGRFEASDVNLAILQRIFLDEVIFDGMMNGSIFMDADLARDFYQVNARFGIREFDFQGFRLDLLDAELLLEEGRITSRLNAIENGDSLLTAELNIPFQPGDPLEFDDSFFREEIYASIRSAEMVIEDNSALAHLLGLEGVTGRVSLLGSASGTAGEPEIESVFRMDNARISGVAVDSLTFNAAFIHETSRFTINSRVVSGGQLAARLQGYIPLAIDMRTFDVTFPDEQNPMDIRVVTNDFNMATFNQFTDPALVRNIAGRINADLNIGGTFDDPELVGNLRLSRASLYLTDNNVTIRDIESDVTFSSEFIELNSLSMVSSGSLTGSGRISLDGFMPQEVDINLRARNFRAFNTRDIQVIFSMDTSIQGGFDNPKLTGSIQLDRGYLYLDNFGERTVEEVTLDEEEPSLFDGMEFYNNLEMELVFRTERNFWVRNRSRPEIQLQLAGELDIVKYRDEDVQVFGAMRANDGYVTQLGRRFDLEEAEVMFSGPPDNPQLNVRTLYELRQPSDIRIWYTIGGTVDEPTFTYESDPQMELGDIISYTLFGRPLNALAGWQQSVAGRSEGGIGDAAFDILLDRVEQLASQALGIDVLTIDNTRTGGQSGTTIKAGKYVSDRMFVALIQELGATVSSQVMLEYQIRRNLEIIITGSDNNRNGLEIQWRRDY
ncbi:MAG: translocation/assembly module TamB [Balneolales bacterium]|nr:translocation/assembly module TamB [Balneolales bacterium]